MGNGLGGIEWSRDGRRRMTMKGQGRGPIRLGSDILKIAGYGSSNLL